MRRLESASTAIFAKENGAAPRELAADGDVLLGKPFDPRELLLIIRGMLESSGETSAQNRSAVSAGPITLSVVVNAAIVASREIGLTEVETRILHELLINAGAPVTRERLTRRGLLRDWSPDQRSTRTSIVCAASSAPIVVVARRFARSESSATACCRSGNRASAGDSALGFCAGCCDRATMAG